MKYLLILLGCLVFCGCGSDYFPQDATCNGQETTSDGKIQTYSFKTVHAGKVITYSCSVNGVNASAGYGDDQFVKTSDPSCDVGFTDNGYFNFDDLNDTIKVTYNNISSRSNGHVFTFQDSQCTHP